MVVLGPLLAAPGGAVAGSPFEHSRPRALAPGGAAPGRAAPRGLGQLDARRERAVQVVQVQVARAHGAVVACASPSRWPWSRWPSSRSPWSRWPWSTSPSSRWRGSGRCRPAAARRDRRVRRAPWLAPRPTSALSAAGMSSCAAVVGGRVDVLGQQRLDLVRVEVRAGLEQQRRGAGDDRGGHRGAADAQVRVRRRRRSGTSWRERASPRPAGRRCVRPGRRRRAC